MALHTHFIEQGLTNAGIILAVNRRWSVGEQMRRLALLIRRKPAEELKNEVEFLSTWGER
jgi:hypothetical protein